MSADGGQHAVDFVVGSAGNGDDGEDGEDEELSSPARDGDLRRTLAVGAAVLIVGALIVRSGESNRTRSGHPVATSPVATSPVATSPVATSPVATSPVAASPVAASQGTVVHPGLDVLRVGPGRQHVPGCPLDAACSLVLGLPDPGLVALTRAFPRSRLDGATVSTVFDEPDGYEPLLLQRSVRAHDGGLAISIEIDKPTAGGPPFERTGRGADGRPLKEVGRVVQGYRVRVSVSCPAGVRRPGFPVLAALAGDAGLVAVQ